MQGGAILATDAAGYCDGDREDALRTPDDVLAVAAITRDRNGEICYPSQSRVSTFVLSAGEF